MPGRTQVRSHVGCGYYALIEQSIVFYCLMCQLIINFLTTLAIVDQFVFGLRNATVLNLYCATSGGCLGPIIDYFKTYNTNVSN